MWQHLLCTTAQEKQRGPSNPTRICPPVQNHRPTSMLQSETVVAFLFSLPVFHDNSFILLFPVSTPSMQAHYSKERLTHTNKHSCSFANSNQMGLEGSCSETIIQPGIPKCFNQAFNHVLAGVFSLFWLDGGDQLGWTMQVQKSSVSLNGLFPSVLHRPYST